MAPPPPPPPEAEQDDNYDLHPPEEQPTADDNYDLHPTEEQDDMYETPPLEVRGMKKQSNSVCVGYLLCNDEKGFVRFLSYSLSIVVNNWFNTA